MNPKLWILIVAPGPSSPAAPMSRSLPAWSAAFPGAESWALGSSPRAPRFIRLAVPPGPAPAARRRWGAVPCTAAKPGRGAGERAARKPCR